ncbi:MAG: hypothetical protein DRP50_03375 [Thermotoga sp.]|nr:MAG: hypothetical protein DRP50_03375 [Thermotoga sp.]
MKTVDLVSWFSQYGIKIILSVIIVAITWLIVRLTMRAIERFGKKTGKLKGMLTTTKMLVSTFIYLIALAVVLSVFGVNVLPLVTGLGAGGIIVGIAIQDVIANFGAGIMLAFIRPFNEGDAIEIGGSITGVVDGISVMSTLMHTFDNKRLIVPNRQVWNKVIVNYSHFKERRFDISVGVDYSADLNAVLRTLNDVIKKTEGIIQERGNSIIFDGFGDSSVNFLLRFWVDVGKYSFLDVKTNLALNIKKQFDENDINIPFPQMDVHMKSNTPA